MVAGKKGFSKEDELLLQDFSKNVSGKSSALFYGNAFIVSAIPVWLFWRIHAMDITASAILFGVLTLASTWLVAFAYRNTKHLLKHRVAVKREGAVTKVSRLSRADFRIRTGIMGAENGARSLQQTFRV